MANTRGANVIRVDTTATFTYAKSICGIKYMGNTSGTAVITDANGGATLWEEEGTSNIYNQVCINAGQGVTVTVANGAEVYLYLK